MRTIQWSFVIYNHTSQHILFRTGTSRIQHMEENPLQIWRRKEIEWVHECALIGWRMWVAAYSFGGRGTTQASASILSPVTGKRGKVASSDSFPLRDETNRRWHRLWSCFHPWLFPLDVNFSNQFEKCNHVLSDCGIGVTYATLVPLRLFFLESF